MEFISTALSGAWIIDPVLIEDERGFFGRTWCQREFREHGLNPRLLQCNISFSHRRGTVRGMHYQAAPREEAKVVRCSSGAIFDVIIDLRPDSPTFKRWISVELSARNRRMVYVPEGFAHGFQTLEDDAEVIYHMSELFDVACARGVRWDDCAFGIHWPQPVQAISEKDKSYPDFS